MKKQKLISEKKVSLEKHKKNIRPNEKSANEIIVYIKKNFTVKEVNLDNLDYFLNIMLNNAKMNLLKHLESTNKIINEDKFEFVIFKIMHDERSVSYFKKENFYNDNIHLIIEKSTRYIEADSSKLQNDLYIFRGISQYDIDNETVDFKTYLFFLNMSEELEN